MAITLERGGGAARSDLASRASAAVLLRTRAFAKARRHTLLVKVLRLALPLGALAGLGFYVLTLGVSWKLGPGRLNVGELQITADDLTMKNPSYFGLTKEGGRYEVRAKRAVMEMSPQAPVKLIDVDGDLVDTNNVVTKLKAKHGLLDNAKSEIELFDGIEIDGSNGLKARLSRARIYSKENRIVSDQPVDVSLPTGRVKGASMTMKTDSKETTFVGNVSVRLLSAPALAGAPQGGSGPGREKEQPVDVKSDNLHVNDAAKTAIFMGSVMARQGDSTLRAPELHVAYEGRAADRLTGTDQPADASQLSRLLATGGCVVTIGTDRRVASDQAQFDAKADTALFSGNVLVNQQKNVLQGQRLFIDRKAGKSRLDAPPDGGPAGRIAATFYQNEPRAGAQPAHKGKAAEAAAALEGGVLGSFKTDPNAPIDIEADTLDIYDTTRQAVFRGNVKSQQGDFIVRTVELIAFYSGRGGLLSNGEEAAGSSAQLTRMEAREQVLVKSKDGQTATGDWATFDVKGNTVHMGDHVVVTRGKDLVQGPRLKIDLTSGTYRFEMEGEPASAPATSASAPQTAPAPPAPADPAARQCPPGKQCVLFYPKEAQERAKESGKKLPPLASPDKAGVGWEPSSSASPVMRGN
jgi:lipopolysaccharide transport protein LptA